METHLLQDLAIVMAVAGAMTLLCHRFRQPVVIGYLIAGFLIGPYTPPVSLVSNLHSIHTMAELGLVFLLFSLGLEFNLPKIQKVGLSAGFAAILEVIGMLGIGTALGYAFGWTPMDSVFLGAILSISSTTIIVKVFTDFKMMQEKFVRVVFGILILEDVVAIAILSVLSGLGKPGASAGAAIVGSFFHVGLFIVLFLIFGLFFIPRFIHWIAEFRSKEVLGVVTLGLCLGGSVLASLTGLSVALGAFLTGAVLAASDKIYEIEEWITPIKDMFSAIFFVSAGMLIQPHVLWNYKGPILIITLVTLIGKILSGTLGSFLAGYDIKTSARIGMSLSQIGEFSFVIASLGLTLNVTSDFLYPLAVTVSSLTTLATPYLIRNSDRWVDGTLSAMPPALRQSLDKYSAWFEKRTAAKTKSPNTTIFSNYLIRLGMYVILVTTLVTTVQQLSLKIEAWDNVIALTIWTVTGALCAPFLSAISKYVNHILLLLVTRSKRLLRVIDIHGFYNASHAGTVLALQIVFLAVAYQFIDGVEPRLLLALVFLVGSYGLKRSIAAQKEWLEKGLDRVIGLATSEPTRQAILKSNDGTLLLFDITDQITLPKNSSYHQKTIREIKLRERSGTTIVAIYRAGKHIANPGPDTELLIDDILILLGDETELGKAKDILT